MILSLFLAAVTATPATLTATLAAARPGDTVTLAAGNYGAVTIPRRDNPRPVTIEARGATATAITFRQTSGWVWRGGEVNAPYSLTLSLSGVTFDGAKRIEVSSLVVTGARTGFTVMRGSEDIALRDNVTQGVRSDGFNVAWAKRVTLTGNRCLDPRPIPAVYDAAGKLVKDGDHPDCIQLWSVAGQEPTQDIVIVGNYARGQMQGITSFNPGQGGVYRYRIEDNVLRLTYWHGITVLDGHDIVIRNNDVRSLPGARAPNYPFQPIRTWIMAKGDGLIVCGNRVPDTNGGQGTGRCRARPLAER